mmetsp:Transcript_46522/g.73531  ORF Transcript_46522/g.73531 Transcript_46522/m.73531 type:complete len:207 (+) Transcript_46522:956-1576(+)
MSSIIFLTFAKGSAATFCASKERSLLCNRSASADKNSRMRRRMPSFSSAASCVPLRMVNAVATLGCCAKVKCCSPVCTSFDDRILIACSNAASSSVRNFCFSSNDSFFSSHSVVTSFKVLSSSALPACVDASSFLSNAIFSIFVAFAVVFSSMSFLEFSMLSFRSWIFMSKACFEFISSFEQSASFSRNSSLSFLSNATMPPDWNS